MKKSILKLTAALFIGTMVLTSCGQSSKDEQKTEEQIAKTEYYCPMKCEDEKTYDKKGSCPVCKMDLVEKE